MCRTRHLTKADELWEDEEVSCLVTSGGFVGDVDRCVCVQLVYVTLPGTNIFAPENGWLEYFLVSFWDGPFSGANC